MKKSPNCLSFTRLCVWDCVFGVCEPKLSWWIRTSSDSIDVAWRPPHISAPFPVFWWVCEREDGSENVTLNCHTVAIPAHTHTPNDTERGFRCANPGAEVGETLPFLQPPPTNSHTQTLDEASQGLTGLDKSGCRHSSASPFSLPLPSPPGVGGEC